MNVRLYFGAKIVTFCIRHIGNRKILLKHHVLAFTVANPECDNVSYHELQSGEGCNTFSHEGLANVNTLKIMLYISTLLCALY